MRFTNTPLGAMVVIPALLGLFPAPCAAGVLYSNLGPGDSFNGGSGWALNVNNGVFTNASQIAASFSVPTAATLETIRVAILYPGSTADQVYGFKLAANNGGVPGVTLDSFSTVPFSSGPSASNFLGVLTSTNSPLLTPGNTYWLVWDSYTSNPARSGVWRLNDQGATGLSYFNGSWQAISNASPAFEVNGSVPEPATAGLVALALGALLHRFRRRQRL